MSGKKRPKPVISDDSIEPKRVQPKLDLNLLRDEINWIFSFKYFRQIENFGFDQSNTKISWFSSLLERLGDLSNRKVSDFLKDGASQSSSGYRFHEINWTQKNIPIQREQLDWLPNNYLKNEQEFPIVQFQISKANGRVVGFFDENWFFNVLLLDPLHNIQPSKSHGYKVDYCSPLPTDYYMACQTIEKISSQECSDDRCGYKEVVANIAAADYQLTNAVIHYLSNDDAQEALNLIDSGCVNDYSEIFTAGLIYLQSE